MAFPIETKVKAMKMLAEGLTNDEVSKKLNISKHTLTNWKKKLFTTGTLENKKSDKKSGNPYKYKPEKIRELLEKSKASKNTKPQ